MAGSWKFSSLRFDLMPARCWSMWSILMFSPTLMKLRTCLVLRPVHSLKYPAAMALNHVKVVENIMVAW